MERLPLGHSLAQLAAALRIGRWDVVFVMAEVADDETSGTQDWGGISRNTRQAHKRPVNKAGVNVSWCWKKEKNPTKIKKRTYLSAGCGQNNRNTLQQDPGADIWSLRLRDGHFPCHKWNVGSFETCIQAPPLQCYITLQCLPLITLADTLTQLTQLSLKFLVHPLLTLDLCKAAERCLEKLDGFWTNAKLFEW